MQLIDEHKNMSEKVKGNVSGDPVMLSLHVLFYGSDHVQQFELAVASLVRLKSVSLCLVLTPAPDVLLVLCGCR